jgi:hypothetical protein
MKAVNALFDASNSTFASFIPNKQQHRLEGLKPSKRSIYSNLPNGLSIQTFQMVYIFKPSKWSIYSNLPNGLSIQTSAISALEMAEIGCV